MYMVSCRLLCSFATRETFRLSTDPFPLGRKGPAAPASPKRCLEPSRTAGTAPSPPLLPLPAVSQPHAAITPRAVNNVEPPRLHNRRSYQKMSWKLRLHNSKPCLFPCPTNLPLRTVLQPSSLYFREQIASNLLPPCPRQSTFYKTLNEESCLGVRIKWTERSTRNQKATSDLTAAQAADTFSELGTLATQVSLNLCIDLKTIRVSLYLELRLSSSRQGPEILKFQRGHTPAATLQESQVTSSTMCASPEAFKFHRKWKIEVVLRTD